MAEKHTKHVYPTGKLTFVIRDEAPFVHMQEPVSHRTVSIELTPWQMELLALKFTHSIGVNRFHEDVSSVFLEPGVTDIPPQPAGIPTAALEGEGVRAAIEEMARALRICRRVFISMSDRGAYPRELAADSDLCMTGGGWIFIDEALSRIDAALAAGEGR